MSARSHTFSIAAVLGVAVIAPVAASRQNPPPVPKPAESKPDPKSAPLTTAALVGKWTATIDAQTGPVESSLELKADPKDDKKFTGTISTAQLGEATLQGNIAEGKFTFAFTMNANGSDLNVTFTGTQLKDGSLAGTLNYGQGDVNWRAVKAKFDDCAVTTDDQAPDQSPKPAPSPSPAAALSVTGQWTMTLEMQMGTANPSLDLTQQGEKITGTYEGRYGKSQLTGTLKNRVLEFSFSMNAEGTEVAMSFRGEVSADFKSIKGDAELGGMGDATWSAVPKKK